MSTKILNINPLESESIHIFREVISQFEKPVLLFSGGKDSITLVRLAQKAFYPAKIPFPFAIFITSFSFIKNLYEFRKLPTELEAPGIEFI